MTTPGYNASIKSRENYICILVIFTGEFVEPHKTVERQNT